MAGTPVRIVQDGIDDSPITIDIVHKRIHKGEHFEASQFLSLAAASAMNVLITTPSAGSYHFTFEVETDSAAVITFSKTPNVTATGLTTISSYNNNENSSSTSLLTHQYLGTYVSSGSILETYVLGSLSAGPSSIGSGKGSGRMEWILAPSSTHLIRTVAGAATCQTVVRMYYYNAG